MVYDVYLEPFFGGGSVFFQKQWPYGKPRSVYKTFGGKFYGAKHIIPLFPSVAQKVNIINDLNFRIMEVYDCLKEKNLFCELSERLQAIDYKEENFQLAKTMFSSDKNTKIDRAIYTLVCNRFSRGGMGKHFAWSNRLRGGRPGDENAWLNFKSDLPKLHEYLADPAKGVVIMSADAVSLLKETTENKSVLAYLDPPYVHSTRVSKKVYSHEMNNDQHRELLEVCVKHKGKLFISGYKNDLYEEYLSDWKVHAFEIANHSGQTKKKTRRLEIVWESP